MAGVAGVCLIVALSLIPGSYRPHTCTLGGCEYFFAHATTALALALGWRTRAQVELNVVGLLVLDCGLELAQLCAPGRSFDLVAALVNGLG